MRKQMAVFSDPNHALALIPSNCNHYYSHVSSRINFVGEELEVVILSGGDAVVALMDQIQSMG